MRTTSALGLTALLLLGPVPRDPQLQEIRHTIFGMIETSVPTARVAVRKLDRVESADTSLNARRAVIRFKPGTRATIARVRSAIRDNTLTPRAAEIRIRGRVEEIGGTPALVTLGGGPAYPLIDHEDAPGRLAPLRSLASPVEVLIDGTVAEKPEKGNQLAITVRGGTIPPRPE